MKKMTFFDENRDYPLYIYERREAALAEKGEGCCLYPSLFGDVGILDGEERISPEAARAVSFYFGSVAGWPMGEIEVAREGEKTFLLPLCHKKEEMIPININICKELFENIVLFSSAVSRDAMLIRCEQPFVLIPSDEPAAVDLKKAESLRASLPIEKMPMLFGGVTGSALSLFAVRTEICDDRTVAHLLCALCRTGKAAYGTEYEYRGGRFCVKSPFLAVAKRRLKILS